MVWQVLDSSRGRGMTEEEGEDGKFIEGEKMVKASTVGELRESGYEVLSIKAELRRNLIRKLEEREPLFEGILGYEDTVMPQLENALLAGQDIIVLGERGQAKSRMIRGLVSLLDEEVPVVEGCEINDDPYAPVCRTCRDKVGELGDGTPVTWLHRDDRYAEKLATPDVTMADLIGDIDPIKVTEGRYLSDELTVHYGLVPRTNRGIFCINELPDLAERLQVGLFNLMQERDIQVKGYQIPATFGHPGRSERQPGGLHEPRSDHHAAKGPVWGPDTHSLSPDAGSRNCNNGIGGAAIRGWAYDPGAALYEGDRGASVGAGTEEPGRESEVGGQCQDIDGKLRKHYGERHAEGAPHG